MSNKLALLNEERDLRLFEKVPGHWRCLSCTAHLTGEEKPACECGGAVVPLSWKLYGNEAWARAEAILAERDALAEAQRKTLAELVEQDVQLILAQSRLATWRVVACCLGAILVIETLVVVLSR